MYKNIKIDKKKTKEENNADLFSKTNLKIYQFKFGSHTKHLLLHKKIEL